MLVAILFLCIGFMIAVLYIDLVFDISALPHRHTRESLPEAVLDPIATYYRYITRNPYLLMFVILTAATCIVLEIAYDLTPRWIGYASLLLIGLCMLTAALKVIPIAQRLSSGRDTRELRSRMVHSMLPFHLGLLFSTILLAVIQFIAAMK
jgi:hypothetical protein